MIKRFRVPDLLANHGPTFIERIGPALHSRRGDWADIETTHPQYRAEVERRYVDADPSVAAKAANLLKATFGAAVSVAKTTCGMNAATKEMFEARLAICTKCPSAIMNADGTPKTCGPMLESAMKKNGKTCGCVLRIKARDKTQKCPQDKWPAVAPAGAKVYN
jgi:hypothetical protein